MKKLLFIISTVFLMIAVSCTEQEDPSLLVPSITKVTNAFGQPVTSASVGEVIKISGENLQNITSVEVDGITLRGTVTIVKGILNIILPSDGPEKPTGEILVNTIGGTARTDFSLKVNLELKKMKCEYVLPGSDLVIYGKFFSANGFSTTSGEVFVGEKKAVIKSVEKDRIIVTVPADAQDNVNVTLKSGDNVWKVPGKYRETDGMITGMEGLGGAGYYLVDKSSHPSDPAVAADIQPLEGSAYIHYRTWTGPKYGTRSGDYAGDFSWVALVSQNWQTNPFPDDALDHPERYALKFEALTNCPSYLQYNFYCTKVASTGSSASIYWPEFDKPEEERREVPSYNDITEVKDILEADYKATFDTNGEWQTVSIPFSNFCGAGKLSSADKGINKILAFVIQCYYFQSNCDFYFDAFRVVLAE